MSFSGSVFLKLEGTHQKVVRLQIIPKETLTLSIAFYLRI